MIDYIPRDYSMTSAQQHKQIIRDYAKQGKSVLLVSAIADGANRGKVQVIYKLMED